MTTKKKRHKKRHYVIKAGSVEALALGCTIQAGWLVCDAAYNEWNVCWDTRAEARAFATEWNVESEAATIELLVVGGAGFSFADRARYRMQGRVSAPAACMLRIVK